VEDAKGIGFGMAAYFDGGEGTLEFKDVIDIAVLEVASNSSIVD
jgi:hypothetical protein